MHDEAPALRCGHCGGEVAPGTRLCPYCRSTVLSRRCESCFHANLADAEHCGACGRPLGLDPVPERDDLACPACRGAFEAVPIGASGRLHDCPACGGQFLDHDTLRALLEERVRIPDTGGRRSWAPVPAGPIRYLACPVCAVLMNRKNFGDHSGVVVDVCRGHGVWFDVGELPRVLAFVERGGLEAAARRAAEEERERRVAERKSAYEGLVVTSTTELRWNGRPVDDLRELVADLVAILRM